MATITILSTPFGLPYQGSATSLELRIYSGNTFMTSDGELIPASPSVYKTAVCPISGNIVTIPTIALDSTTDSLTNPNAKYSLAALYEPNKSTPVAILLDSFEVSHVYPTTTWVNLTNQREGSKRRRIEGVYTINQTDAAIQEAISNIAVPTIGVSLTEYGNSLTTALSELGTSSVYTLNITTDTVVEANLTVPPNIILNPLNGATISVANDSTLTISKMMQVGNVKVFDVESGSHVTFVRGAVEYYNLAWWAGIANDSDVTNGMNDAFYALQSTNGGRLFIPHQSVETSGSHDIPEHSHIFGNGQQATIITVLGANYCFKIGELCRYTRIENMTISGGGSKNNYGVLYDGEYPNSVYNTTIRNVLFSEMETGIDIRRGTDLLNDWEVMQANFIDCTWSLVDEAIKINTVNSGISVIRPVFYLNEGGVAVNALKVGSLYLEAPRTFGSSTPDANIPASDGSRFLAVSGIHNNITITDAQDENIQTFLETSGNDYRLGNIAIYNGLVQSDIDLQADRTIISEGNFYVSVAADGDNADCGNFRDGASGTSVIYSKNDYFQNREYGTGTVLATHIASRFTGDSYFSEKSEPVTLIKTSKGFTKFVHSEQLHGQSRPPVEILTDETTGFLARLGEMDADETFSNGYTIVRSGTDGWLEVTGSQSSPFRGIRTNGGIELTTANDGIILKSPNGTRYVLTVSNAGTAVFTAV